MQPRLIPQRPAPYLISIATVAVIGFVLLAVELAARYVAPERCARARAIGNLARDQLKLLDPCARRVVENGQELLHVVSTFGQENWLPSRKTPGAVRIAIVGESSGELLGDSLTDLVADLQCGSRYEVLNCARSASDLAMTERMFDDALGYEPDAVVVVFGHNIHYQYDLDATQLRARKLVASSCLLASLLPEAHGDAGLHMSSVDPKLAQLELFLRRAVETSRRRDIRLVLSTMPVNLWMPPYANGSIRDARGSEAMLLAEEGRVDAALANLAAPHGHAAESRFQAGVWLARVGRTADAYAQLQRAVDEDFAEAWRQVNRTDEARRINEMARQRDPGNVHALHQAAILAWRSGNDVRARAFATEAMRLDPTDQLAPALLRRLAAAH